MSGLNIKHMPDITVTTENKQQFDAALRAGNAGIVYLDSAYFDAADYASCVQRAHASGMSCGLRLPQVWRERADRYYGEKLGDIMNAGFDIFLFRNMEALLWLRDNYPEGILRGYALDHGIYIWNTMSVRMVMHMLSAAGISGVPRYMTLPLELSLKDMRDIDMHGTRRELVVYGRAPMMVTAQCIKKTASGCDRKMETLMLKDRKNALMPVKNICSLCINTIYNSVPTVIYDMEDEIARLSPDSIRYEFTTESAKEVQDVLGGKKPPAGSFTRGHAGKSAL